jgi:predicted N-acetyltransferase YhbS
MTSEIFAYRLEEPADDAAIEHLHDVTMGPGRFARAAFRLREGVPQDPALSFVATVNGRVMATVRLTPIRIGGRPALLLGPLAVEPAFAGRGAGKTLVRMALKAAAEYGHRAVLLVGDEPYYGPLGFEHVKPGAITLPAPADPNRILVAGLRAGALDGLSGAATRAAD